MPTFEQVEAARLVLYNAVHPQHKKSKSGFQNNAGCPWCKKHDDYRNVAKKGKATCSYCGNIVIVDSIASEPVISLKQVHPKFNKEEGVMKDTKPPFVPGDREEWEREQQEAQRVAVAHVDIDREDQVRAQILGIDDRDLVEVFRGLPTRYVQQFATLRNMLGRDKALLKLPEWRQQHIAEQKAKSNG